MFSISWVFFKSYSLDDIFIKYAEITEYKANEESWNGTLF